MTMRLITPPAVEPLALDELKAMLRVTDARSDLLLTSLILPAARQAVESHTNRALITQTWELALDEFPEDDTLVLPLGRALSLTSLTYVDGAGATTPILDAQFDGSSDYGGRVLFAAGGSWPSPKPGLLSPIKLRFTAGYGPAGSDVPQELRAAIALWAGNIFENREATISGTIIADVPFGFDMLVNHYWVPKFV